MAAIPAVEVNLDLPPPERWAWVVDYREHFRSARQLILGEIGVDADRPTPVWVRAGARALLSAVPANFREEMEAIGAACGESASELALVNYLYELKAKCSSFVVPRDDGRPLHGRTLDWPGCAVLCSCTVRLRFLRGGSLLYEARARLVAHCIHLGRPPHCVSLCMAGDLVAGLPGRAHGVRARPLLHRRQLSRRRARAAAEAAAGVGPAACARRGAPTRGGRTGRRWHRPLRRFQRARAHRSSAHARLRRSGRDARQRTLHRVEPWCVASMHPCRECRYRCR